MQRLDGSGETRRRGYISARRHPTEPLTIYNYTAKCQYAPLWTPETRHCRGLIVHDGGRIVARPFPKFFNFEEHSRSEIAFSKPFTVAEKIDGSLGVLYPDGDGWAIASRARLPLRRRSTGPRSFGSVTPTSGRLTA